MKGEIRVKQKFLEKLSKDLDKLERAVSEVNAEIVVLDDQNRSYRKTQDTLLWRLNYIKDNYPEVYNNMLKEEEKQRK